MQKFELIKPVGRRGLEEMSELATQIMKEHYDPIVGSEINDHMLGKFQSVEGIEREIDGGAEYFFATVAGEKAGADIIVIETMSDIYETKAAVLAAKENTNLPVFVTVVFDEKGKLLTGSDVNTVVAVLEGLGVDALGINCGLCSPPNIFFSS